MSITAMVQALEWYEEKVADCRKFGSEGNSARALLDKDGGQRAANALAGYPSPTSASEFDAEAEFRNLLGLCEDVLSRNSSHLWLVQNIREFLAERAISGKA